MTTNPRTDYDSPWKVIIERYFPDFMAFFFPQAHADIDWQRGYTFLDKELQQITPEAETGPRRVDKLVKVYLHNGQETWVLIHIEIQGQPEAMFAERMLIYHYRIFDRYRRPVVSLAILTDDQPHWRPQQYVYELWGCRLSLDFPNVKLLDYQENQDLLAESHNPFAVVVLAHLQTMRTRHQPQERYAAKLNLAKMLYQRGYGREDIIALFRFIDWVMTLPQELAQQFRTTLHQIEENKKVEYISSVEQMAIEEGLQKGMQQGMQQGLQKGLQRGLCESILDTLEVRFGHVPDNLPGQLEQVVEENALRVLLRRAVTIDSLATFTQLLPETNQTPS